MIVQLMIIFNALVMISILFFSEFTIGRGIGGNIVAKRTHNPVRLVVWLYVLSAVLAIFIDPNSLPDFHPHQYKAIYFLVYTICITVTLIPCVLLRKYRVPRLDILMTPGVKLVLYFASIAGWFSVLYQLPYVYASMRIGAVVTREALNVQGVALLPNTPLTTIAVGVSTFFIIFQILFVLCLIKRLGKWLTLSMLIGSLSYPISLATFGGRTGVFLYTITFLFIYLVFKPQLQHDTKLRVRRIGVISGAVGGVVFCIVTYQRFFQSHNLQSLIYGTFGYLAQQPYVFAESIFHGDNFYGIGHNLPLVAALIGNPYGGVVKTVPYQWMFGTFIENFYMIGGFATLFLGVGVVAGIFIYYCVRFRGSNSVAFLAIYLLYFQFMSSGVFYFILGSWSGNIYMVCMVLLFYLIKISVRKSRDQ